MRQPGFLEAFEKHFSSVCLGGLVLVLAAQVFFRYVLQIGLSWSEEVSRFLFIWFVYVSASYAVQRGSHIRVTAIVDAMPPKVGMAMRVLSDLVWVAFNALVVVSGYLLIKDMIEYPVYSTSLRVPLAFIHAVIPFAHSLMIVRILQSYFGPATRARGTWPTDLGKP